MTYKKIDRQAGEFGETNDCSVKAIALVTRASYANAHAALAAAGREARDGTPRYLTARALDALGFRVVRWTGKRLALAVGRRRAMLCDAANDGGWDTLPDMLLFVDEHVAALVNGKVEDWTADRRAVILEAWEIVRKRDTIELGHEPPAVIYL